MLMQMFFTCVFFLKLPFTVALLLMCYSKESRELLPVTFCFFHVAVLVGSSHLFASANFENLVVMVSTVIFMFFCL